MDNPSDGERGVRHRANRAKVHFRHLRHEKRQDRQATHGGKVRPQCQKPARMCRYQGLGVRKYAGGMGKIYGGERPRIPCR